MTKLRRLATRIWEREFAPILGGWGFVISKAYERKSRSTIYRVHYKSELVGELYLKDYRINDAWVTLYLFPPEALWAVVSQSIGKEMWIRPTLRKCMSYLVAGAARGKIRCYNCPETIFYSDGKTLTVVLTFMVLKDYWVWQMTYRFREVEDATTIKKPLSENPLRAFEELKKVAVFTTTV
jgi:hypothetical protein